MITVRQWNTGVVGHGGKRGHAGHNFEGNLCIVKLFRLLAAATEHVGIATFEAHDGFTFARFGDELFDDVGAIVFGVLGTTTAEQDFRTGGGKLENGLIHQGVVDDDVGAAEQFRAAQREETCVAGAGADQINSACLIHPTGMVAGAGRLGKTKLSLSHRWGQMKQRWGGA